MFSIHLHQLRGHTYAKYRHYAEGCRSWNQGPADHHRCSLTKLHTHQSAAQIHTQLLNTRYLHKPEQQHSLHNIFQQQPNISSSLKFTLPSIFIYPLKYTFGLKASVHAFFISSDHISGTPSFIISKSANLVNYQPFTQTPINLIRESGHVLVETFTSHFHQRNLNSILDYPIKRRVHDCLITSKCSSTTPYFKCVAPKCFKLASPTVTLPAFLSWEADLHVCGHIAANIIRKSSYIIIIKPSVSRL